MSKTYKNQILNIYINLQWTYLISLDSQSKKSSSTEIRKSITNIKLAYSQVAQPYASKGSILSPLTIFKRCILRQIHIQHKVILLKITWFKIIQNILWTKAVKMLYDLAQGCV